MRKIIHLLFILSIITIVSACGGNDSNETANNVENSSGYNGDSHNWKVGFNTPEDSTRGEAAKAFKKVVEEKTGGAVTVELFAGETLGSEQEMLEQVQSGALDMQMIGGGALQNIVPEYSVLQLPFMVDDFEEAYAVLDGEIGDELKELAYEKGFKVLTHSDLGMAQITNSKRAVESPEDLKGLKIRSPEEPTSITTFEQLGASVTTMPFTEVYMGLQQGVIDGQFNPLDAIYENNMHEVQDYLTLTNHFYYHVNVTMNKDLYEGLDSELKAIVDEAAQAAQTASRKYTQEKDEEMLDVLKDDFVEIVTDPDIEAFRSKINYEDYYDFVGEDIIKKTQAFIEEYRTENY